MDFFLHTIDLIIISLLFGFIFIIINLLLLILLKTCDKWVKDLLLNLSALEMVYHEGCIQYSWVLESVYL